MTNEVVNGVDTYIMWALSKWETFVEDHIRCYCLKCKNMKFAKEVKLNLYWKGFVKTIITGLAMARILLQCHIFLFQVL